MSRSPVLGYNHNVRYAGRLWHAQTEDSGVQNPHIYTHLFHDGTILATKKVDYDPTSDVLTVQKLMQSQHKAMLRELKAGGFDQKIERIYGPIVREPAADAAEREDAPPAPISSAPPPAAPAKPKHPEDERATIPDLAPFISSPPAQAPQPPPVRAAGAPADGSGTPPRRPSLTPARPAIAVTARAGSNPGVPATRPAAPPPTLGNRSAARSAPPTIGSGRSGVAQTNRPTAEGVIVGRPSAVIVGGHGGGNTGKQREAQDFWKTDGSGRRPAAPNAAPPGAPHPPAGHHDPQFGGDLISEKSLDEVILAYLSEDAPKK